MLNDQQIAELAWGGLISPYNEELLNPVSYDLTLSSSFKVPNPKIKHYFEDVEVNTWFNLAPQQFILGATQEYIKMPDTLTGIVCGKSSRAREGCCVEFAGLVDPGFEGTITLEIYNFICWELSLKVGMPICQITFFENDAPQIKKYKECGHYNFQVKATNSYHKL